MTEDSDAMKKGAARPGDPDPDADGPMIEPTNEMEAALRAAEESLDARQHSVQGGAGDASADKLTIEMLANELQSLKDEFESRSKELEEAKDRHLRVQAEMDNFRRRSLKEKQESLRYGQQNLVKDLLGVVDNLQRAIEHAEENGDADLQGLLQGVELVNRELLATLGKHGVNLIEAHERQFDPAFHEAMGQVENDTVPTNTVVAELQTGYMLHDRLIRPSRVMVSKESAPGRAPKGESKTDGAQSAGQEAGEQQDE